MTKQAPEKQKPQTRVIEKGFQKIVEEEMRKAMPEVERYLRERDAVVARSRFRPPPAIDTGAGSDDGESLGNSRFNLS